jgi:hypothetical protein
MKSFKQFGADLEAQSVPLEEANLARLHDHLTNRNVGIITAHRGHLPADENVSRNRQLENHIRQAGYGFVHVDGHYVEHFGTPEARKVSERAYMVIGKEGEDHGELKGFLKKHGAAFDQDSVLHKAAGEKEAKLIGTSQRESAWPSHNEEVSVGAWHPNRAGEFHSSLHNKKTFQFSESFESKGVVETHGSNFFTEWGKFLHEQKNG